LASLLYPHTQLMVRWRVACRRSGVPARVGRHAGAWRLRWARSCSGDVCAQRIWSATGGRAALRAAASAVEDA